jgi:hypothetical protein
MINDTQLHKELDLIQDVIKRMADNSFKVKAWMLAILGSVLALSNGVLFVDAAKEFNTPAAFFLSIFLVLIVLVFWYLDGFFLQKERLYREMYKWVIKNRPHTDLYLYDLNTFERVVGNDKVDFQKITPGIFSVMLSQTLFPFYLLPFLFVVGLMLYQVFR